MKCNAVVTFILISLSLSSQARTLADEEDLKKFNETNYCQGCDLSGVMIYENHDNGFLLNSYAIKTEFKGSLYKTVFDGSIMTYAKFGGGWSKVGIQETNFDKVNLSYSNFNNVDLSGANLSNVNLSNSDLNNVNLSGVNFTNANLNNVIIRNCILIGSNLTQDQFKQIKGIECTIMPNGELNTKKC